MTQPQPPQRQSGASITRYRAGGHDYNEVFFPNCFVCNSPYRQEIENEVALGRSYAMIERSVRVIDPETRINRRSINRHYDKGHMPLHHAETRATLEARALARGQSIEHGVRSLLDGLAAAEVVVQKAFSAIISGELKPDVKDMLKAIQILETFKGEDLDGDSEAWVEAFLIHQEEYANELTPEAKARVDAKLASNPVLRGLIAREQARRNGTDFHNDSGSDYQEDEVESPRMLDSGGDS